MLVQRRALLPLGIAVFAWSLPLAGQQQPGSLRLTEVLPGGALLGCPGIQEVAGEGASESQLEVRQGGVWQEFTPPAGVDPDEVVAVPVPLDARMRIDYPAAVGGDIFLVPSFPCYPSLNADTVVVGILPDSSHARYRIFTHLSQENGQRVSRLGISAETGSMLVVGYRGPPFFVRAAGDTATIYGTTIAILMAPSGDEGLLYLQDGTATLSRLPGEQVQPGQLVHLRREAGPVLVGSSIAETLLPGLREGLRHHTELPWSSLAAEGSIRSRRVPWRWLAGSVVVASAITYMVWPRDGNNPGSSNRTGTVIVHLP